MTLDNAAMDQMILDSRKFDNSIFAPLMAPFDPDDVRERPMTGGGKAGYITARVAMNRLDDVLGPGNWTDEYLPQEKSVICKLTIRLPDGTFLTKSDAGGYAGMTDQGDDDKSGYSDAFKRAAAKFGVGRYLYREGLPGFVVTALSLSAEQLNVKGVSNRNQYGSQQESSRPGPTARPQNNNQPDHPHARSGNERKFDENRIPTTGKQLFAWAKSRQDNGERGLVDAVSDIGKKMGFGDRMTQWGDGDVREVWDSYHGTPSDSSDNSPF